MNVAEYLMEGKGDSGTALVTLDGTYTYSDLRRAAAAVAGNLVRYGGRKGDRVLLLSDNGFFWVAAYLGTLHAGLVCVPLPVKAARDEVEYIVGNAEPAFAFVEARSAQKFVPALRDAKVFCDRGGVPGVPDAIAFEELQRQAPDSPVPPAEVEPNEIAVLMFTSGSTGKPRGVMVSARNIIANTNSIIEYLSLTAADRILAVLPFHYSFGTSLLHTHLRVGGSIVVEPRFMYPDKVLQRMLQTECTGFAGVPSHYQILLRRSGLASMRFPRLRYVQQAGGHLAPSFVKELRQALPDTQIFIMYGLTEAAPRLSYLPPELLASKPGSIGKAIPGVKLYVLDESGQQVRPGKIGHIVAEGENITLGYWRNQEDTAKYFRDGRLHTCDLATVDEDGFIYIVDRAADFLKCGGQRVSCRYLEEVLLECGSLVEAAVIGIADAELGEAAKAFVVPRERKAEGMAESLHLFCRSHLPPPLVPRQIVIVDSLPKNSSGKVLKQKLREQHLPGGGELRAHGAGSAVEVEGPRAGNGDEGHDSSRH